MSGVNFNPHVSTGVVRKEYLDKMLAEPFEPFTFSPSGAAVFQLGPFGTAAKKLKRMEFEAVGGLKNPAIVYGIIGLIDSTFAIS
jgi:hypothetical protein